MASSYNGKTLTLNYRFVAIFADGHQIIQSPEDESKLDPEKRSAFYDVLEYEKNFPLVRFVLNEEGYGVLGRERTQVFVDLTTGLFTVNGVEINIADQNFIPTEPLRLIYFRETHVQQTMNQQTGVRGGDTFYINRYFIGWQTTVNNQKELL